MIIYTDENLFLSPAQTLVNTVNTVGVMGKGIAKEFKKYYPLMYEKYRVLSKSNRLDIGQLMLSKDEPVLYRKKEIGKYRRRWVLNFPTKRHWRNKSKIEYIDAGLAKFVKEYKHKNIESVSFPPLGVGNGGLKWNDVKKLMVHYLSQVDIPVYIHLYNLQANHYEFKADITTKIENNLNTAHDSWKNNIYLENDILHNENINCDGIILPGSNLYEKARQFQNIRYFSLLNENKKAIKLTLDTKASIEDDNYQQLNLF